MTMDEKLLEEIRANIGKAKLPEQIIINDLLAEIDRLRSENELFQSGQVADAILIRTLRCELNEIAEMCRSWTVYPGKVCEQIVHKIEGIPGMEVR
jgi:hypothetical protein